MKTKQGIILFIVILFPFVIFAQTKWTLDSCISHALNNNYSIKQSLIDLETKNYNYKPLNESFAILVGIFESEF